MLSISQTLNDSGFYLTELIIGFDPTTYEVSEAQGVIQVCFEVQQNNVLNIPGQAILNTQIGSATCEFI